MKQTLEVRKAGMVPATDLAPADRPSVLGDADLDQVAGGGGAGGGVIGMRTRSD